MSGPESLDDLRTRVEELDEENSLLLLQMHRLYGELHASHPPGCPGTAVSRADVEMLAFLRQWWSGHPQEELTIDLSRPICGSGWHAAETDGRWAGPGTVSTICTPALPAGMYSVRLEVVGAMHPDIVFGAQLRVDGEAIDVEILFDGYPALLMGIAEVAGPGRVNTELELRVPESVCPRDRGEADDRLLSMRVRSVTWTRLEGR